MFPTALQKEFTKERDVHKLPLMMHSGIVRFLGDGKMGKEFVLVLELATHVSEDYIWGEIKSRVVLDDFTTSIYSVLSSLSCKKVTLTTCE